MKVDEIVARWAAEEGGVRSHLVTPGVASAGDVAGKSVTEVFQATFAGELPQQPIGDVVDPDGRLSPTQPRPA